MNDLFVQTKLADRRLIGRHPEHQIITADCDGEGRLSEVAGTEGCGKRHGREHGQDDREHSHQDAVALAAPRMNPAHTDSRLRPT